VLILCSLKNQELLLVTFSSCPSKVAIVLWMTHHPNVVDNTQDISLLQHKE
jgi:hypothetical protein